MKATTPTYRWMVGFVLGLLVLAATIGSALAASDRPAGMSQAEHRALMIRSQALNELYGGGAPAGMDPAEYRALIIRGKALNALYKPTATPSQTAAESRAERIRGEAMNALYGNGLTRMSPAEFRALFVRSAALNELYGAPPNAPTPVVPVVTVEDGFHWTDAVIGAGFTAGVLLLAGAGALVARRSGRLAHTHH